MKHLSTLEKRVALLFGLFLCFVLYGQAQYKVTGGPVGGSCGEIYYEINTTGSDCGQHGKIDVTLTGPAIEGIGGEAPTFTGVKYRCYVTGSDASEVEFSTSKVMENLAPGKYTVEIEGKCAESSNSIIPKMLSVAVDVDQIGAWRPLDMEAKIVANPLGCMPNGAVTLYNITGGLPPYKVEIVSAPAGYTPKVLHSGNSLPASNTIALTDLIAGTYKVVFSEGSSCKEEVALTITVGGLGDALPEFYSLFVGNVYPSQYSNSSTALDHCRSLTIRRNYSFNSDDALMFKYYVENWENYFEYAVYYKGDNISNPSSLSWNSFPASSSYLRLENLRHPVSQIKIEAAAGNYYDVYPNSMPRLLVRVKGCTNVKEYDLFRTTRPYQSSSALTYRDCGQAFISTGMYTDYDGVFCWPYTWQIVKTKDASGTAIPEEVIQTGTRDWGTATTTVGPLAPGYYEYRATDSGSPAFTWVPNTYTITASTPATLINTSGVAWGCEEQYLPVLYYNSPYPATISALSKIEYVATEKSTNYTSTWTLDPSFPAPPLPVIDMTQISQTAKNKYPYCISLWATSLDNVPIPNIPTTSSWSYYQTAIAQSRPIDIGTEHAIYRHKFLLTDTCGVTTEKIISSPSAYYTHIDEPDFEVERGCLGGIKIVVPNINSLIYYNYRRATNGGYNQTAYVWVKEKPADATVTYNNTNNYDYLTNTNQWLETDKPGKYVIGVTSNSYGISNADHACTKFYELNIEKAPTFELDEANTAMYRCPDDSPGRGHVEVTVKNGMGPFRFELVDEHGTVLAENTTGIFPNGSWSSVISSDKYIIKAYDEGCLPTKVVKFEQGIKVVDLGNDNTAWIRDPNVCEGDSIVLQALALGKTDYNWYFVDENDNVISTYAGRRVVIKDATLAMSGRYISEVTVPGCSNAIVYDTVHVSVGERLMYWKTDAEDDNWFNTNNWLKVVNGSLEPVKTVPAPCSTVHIPGNSKNYPNLSKWDASFGQAACDSIIYHYGSETAYPNYLSYQRAIVQYNMGYYDRRAAMGTQPSLNKDDDYPGNTGSAFELERARWYMIATPLKQMVGGDFGLAGYPKIYQRLFNTTQAEAGKPMADGFSGVFAKYNIPTEETGNALALWIPDYDNYTGSKDQKYLNNLEGIVEIPYIEDKGVIAANRPLHKYEINGKDSTSYFYYFDRNLNPVMEQFDTMKRGYKAYRFVFEDDNDEKLNETVDGEYVTLYRTSLLASYDGTGRIMVGNPFMSSISFDKLYALNSSVIKNTYQVVTANEEILQYTVGSPLNDPSFTANIPPLQSFIIERINPSANEKLSFHLNGTKSVISAAATFNAPLPKPRAATAVKQDFLKISSAAIGATASGTDYKSMSGVVFNYTDQNNVGRSILDESLTEKAEVFFTDTDKYLYSQLVKNTIPKPEVFNAGVYSQFTGNIKFTINYDGKLIRSVKFVDTHLDKTVENVANGWEYTFTHNIKTENGKKGLDTNRFQFHMEYYAEDGVGISTNEGNVEISYINRTLSVQSDYVIEYVKILNLAGITVVGEKPSNEYTYKKVLNVAPGAYIVQVVLENGEVETSKIIVQ